MKIIFVGDVMLGRGVNAILKDKPSSYPWGNTLDIIHDADLRICNLECVISDIGEPWPDKTFNFRTDSKNVEVLKAARFSPISIANNHTLDFGIEALDQMISMLKTNSINFAGAGSNIIEASMPALENGGKNYVGMIAFTDNESDWEAGEEKPGIFYTPVDLKDNRAKLLFENIKKVRDDVKILIVSAHWGSNWGYEPPKEHIEFAHALIDAGADIIFGHSAHVFRGIEIYKRSLPSPNGERKGIIIYSAGNFVDDYAVDEIEKNDESFIFKINTDEKYKLTRMELYPTLIRNLQAKMANELQAEQIAFKMQNLCTKLQTKSNWLPEKRLLQVLV